MGTYNWQDISERLNKLIHPKMPAVGMKFFAKKKDAQRIPKIRLTDKQQTVCAFIGQSRYNSWTVGVLPQNCTLNYCKTINGLFPPDELFKSGKIKEGVWHKGMDACKAHHDALNIPPEVYEAIVISPLSFGRIEEPDVCLQYLTPGQVFSLMAGYTYEQYEKLSFDFVGESTCTDSWMRTLVTGKPSLGIPCFAEKKFGGAQDEEMALALTPEQLVRAIEGTEILSRNGLRWPVAPYSIFCAAAEGFPPDYLNY